MEILNLAATALVLAQPFLSKIGEGAAKKIGEDIWNVIKKPFNGDANFEKSDTENLKVLLVNKLNNDADFKKVLEEAVGIAQKELTTNVQQINNNGTIDKQFNIGSMSGDMNF
jgi:hypothetical protein